MAKLAHASNGHQTLLTGITYDSCELEWNPPSDNGGGGQVISHYSVTGTPDDISIITGNTMYTRQDLTPNTIYTFNVSANNSLVFGDPAVVQCSTTRNIPPGFTDVSVCLDVNMTGYTKLNINYSPCPIVITDTDNTPPVDNYTVNIVGLLSVDVFVGTCDYTTPVSEGNIYTVEMSVNNVIGSNKTTAVTNWLRDIEVMYVTNTSAVIQYTTADCVIPDNLKIELNIDVDYSNINPSSVVSYESSTTDQFTVLGLEPNAVVTYTLQVIAEVSDNFLNIGMSRTSSFTVISATTSSTTSVSDSTTSTRTPSQSITPPPDDAPVIGGVVGGVVIISLIIIIIIVFGGVWYRKKKLSGKLHSLKPTTDRSTTGPVSNVIKTSNFEMNDNQAYGVVTIPTISTSPVYETIT